MRTESLQRFISTIKILVVEDGEGPVVAIQLVSFHSKGFENGLSLDKCKPINLPHGFELGARDYFEECMKVLQPLRNLEPDIYLSLHLCCPYRDFWFIKTQTASFRRAANIEAFELSLQEQMWLSVP